MPEHVDFIRAAIAAARTPLAFVTGVSLLESIGFSWDEGEKILEDLVHAGHVALGPEKRLRNTNHKTPELRDEPATPTTRISRCDRCDRAGMCFFKTGESTSPWLCDACYGQAAKATEEASEDLVHIVKHLTEKNDELERLNRLLALLALFDYLEK